MADVCFVGLGKLGIPVATTFAAHGNKVYGYDQDAEKRLRYRNGVSLLYEPGLDQSLAEQLEAGNLVITESLAEAVDLAEIIFVAVPTPSLPDDSFDPSYVKSALEGVCAAIRFSTIKRYRLIVVISTVLPGTCREVFLPTLYDRLGPQGEHFEWGFAYNAQFIAMGTVIEDTLHPEFALIGEVDQRSGDLLERFYRDTLRPDRNGRLRSLYEPQLNVARMSIENAEIVKCAYNNFISFKIVYANTLMEMCEKIPLADCDVVSDTLALATDRLLSPKYLRGGLGDSGSCHPRDNRALSYLSKRLDLAADPFAFVTEARVKQLDWVVEQILVAYGSCGLIIKLLGLTFKPNTNLTDDSCALYINEALSKRGHTLELCDIAVANTTIGVEPGPRLYVITTAWQEWLTYPYKQGSVILDPHGLLKVAPEGCTLISLGRKL